jgi:hypothetical protein
LVAVSFIASLPFELDEEEEGGDEVGTAARGEVRWLVVPCGNTIVVVDGVEWMVAGGMCTCDMWRGCWWWRVDKCGKRGKWGRPNGWVVDWRSAGTWVPRGRWGRSVFENGKFECGTWERGFMGCMRDCVDGTCGGRAERVLEVEEEEEWEPEWEEEEDVEDEEVEEEDEGADGGEGRRRRVFNLKCGDRMG